MADEHTSPRLGRAVGVPRRFAVGTGLVILTMYSLLFALLDWLAFLPSVFVGVVAFVTGVGFAQMALFGGHKPREASFLAGGVLLPVIYHVLVWMEVATRRGLFARQLSIAEALTHIAVIPWLVVAGVGLAYVAGCGTAGVFLLLGRLAQRQAERRRREPRQSSPWDELPVETVPAEDVPEANREQSAGPGDPTPERPASRWDDRLWNRLTGTLRRLWPYQQGRPWGDALSVAILYVLFVGPAIPATFLEPDVGQARGVAVLLALFGFILTAAYLLIRLRVVLRTLLLMVIGAAGAWIVAESIGDQLYVSDHTYNWIVADLLEFHRWERGDAQNYPVTECLPPWAMAVCGGMVTPLLLIAFTLLPTRLFSRDKKLTNRKAWTKAGVGFLVLCHLVAYLGLAYLANTTSQQRMHWGYLHNAFW